jgi:hypothetical protein
VLDNSRHEIEARRERVAGVGLRSYFHTLEISQSDGKRSGSEPANARSRGPQQLYAGPDSLAGSSGLL